MILNENGIWLFFDDTLIKSSYQLKTLNNIHIFSKNKAIKYDLNIIPKFNWLVPFNNINIYNSNYIENLLKIIKYNNPITYIEFNDYDINKVFNILNTCIQYLIPTTLLQFTNSNKEFIKNIKKNLKDLNIKYKIK